MSYSVTLWKLSLVPLRSVVFSGKNTSLLAAQVQSAFCHIFLSQPNNKQMSLNWVITGIHLNFSSILQPFIKVKIKVNFIWDNFLLSKPVLSYQIQWNYIQLSFQTKYVKNMQYSTAVRSLLLRSRDQWVNENSYVNSLWPNDDIWYKELGQYWLS